jgi:hypothetical protein
MKHFVSGSVKFLMVVFAMLNLSPISIAFGTPPTPLVQLQLPKEKIMVAS